MVYHTRRDYYHIEFTSHCGHSKHLYKLVSKLTGSMIINNLKEYTSNKDLADEFAQFFSDKIMKIRNILDEFPLYDYQSDKDVPFPMVELCVLSESEVQWAIMDLQTKSCEINIILTETLKENLDSLIKLITHIVNLSLKKGKFYDEWKNSILWPWKKKSATITEKSNCRPVSNLEFLAEIIEKCVLNQYT